MARMATDQKANEGDRVDLNATDAAIQANPSLAAANWPDCSPETSTTAAGSSAFGADAMIVIVDRSQAPEGDPPTSDWNPAIGTPFFPLPSTGTYVGGWFIEPYDAKAENGLPVRFTNSFGLSAGAQVHVYGSSYDDFAWLDLGTFTESGGFLVADNATTGKLTVLATLVIMDESGS